MPVIWCLIPPVTVTPPRRSSMPDTLTQHARHSSPLPRYPAALFTPVSGQACPGTHSSCRVAGRFDHIYIETWSVVRDVTNKRKTLKEWIQKRKENNSILRCYLFWVTCRDPLCESAAFYQLFYKSNLRFADNNWILNCFYSKVCKTLCSHKNQFGDRGNRMTPA
jgi:hypothetical protein